MTDDLYDKIWNDLPQDFLPGEDLLGYGDRWDSVCRKHGVEPEVMLDEIIRRGQVKHWP